MRPAALALLLTVGIGALVGTLAGFVVAVSAYEPLYRMLPLWLLHPLRFGWWPWPMFGGLIAGLSITVARLSRP